MRAVPSLDKAEIMEGIEGLPPRPVSRPVGCSFSARCPDAGPECLPVPPAKVVISGSHWVRCVRVRPDAQNLRDRQAIQPVSVIQARPAVLEVQELRASFGTNEVLHGVGFTLPEDTCVAVVGESGSGKTTLARCIIGMHANWKGSIRYGGNELAHSARERGKDVLKSVQYVFQDPYTALNPRKTVGQLVAQPIAHFYNLPRAEVDARVVKVLEDVSLSADFLNRYPDQLSGGERQRAAIARALAAEPDLLVCDEVSSALDVSVQATIIEMLRRLQAEHRLTMLFITHNLALVRGIAQSVIVLSQGRIVEQASVEEVFERPRDPYTIRLMSDAPRLSAAATGSAGVPSAGARQLEEE
jgi:peptide/nickel transport system ATP-binding protein